MHRKSEKKRHAMQLRREDLLSVTTVNGEADLKIRGFKKLEKSEYMYQGRLYDLVRREQRDNRITYHFAYDSYEGQLLTFLKSFFSSPSPERQTQSSSKIKYDNLKQWLVLDYKLPAVYFMLRSILEREPLPHHSAPFRPIPVPPPQAA